MPQDLARGRRGVVVRAGRRIRVEIRVVQLLQLGLQALDVVLAGRCSHGLRLDELFQLLLVLLAQLVGLDELLAALQHASVERRHVVGLEGLTASCVQERRALFLSVVLGPLARSDPALVADELVADDREMRELHLLQLLVRRDAL